MQIIKHKGKIYDTTRHDTTRHDTTRHYTNNLKSETNATPRQLSNSETQVISKQRVADHGEVFTHPREVNAMLDLVKHESERIDSRFLEPACGTGNFLVEILARKLAVVEQKYKKSQYEFERNAVIAVCSIYGIDILSDNVVACRERLFSLFSDIYQRLYKSKTNVDVSAVVRYVLSKNILHGDALTLKTVATEHKNSTAIVFSEWTAISGSSVVRRDYVFEDLVDFSTTPPPHELAKAPADAGMGELFAPDDVPVTRHSIDLSDDGKYNYHVHAVAEFAPVHFMQLPNLEQSSASDADSDCGGAA